MAEGRSADIPLVMGTLLLPPAKLAPNPCCIVTERVATGEMIQGKSPCIESIPPGLERAESVLFQRSWTLNFPLPGQRQ